MKKSKSKLSILWCVLGIMAIVAIVVYTIVEIIISIKKGKVDWAQFIPSLLATAVGFLLALVGEFVFEKIHENSKNKREVTEFLERIKSELVLLKKILSLIDSSTLEKEPLKTPVWEEAINIGYVAILPSVIRESLFKLYKQIREFNSWFEIKTNYYFAHYNDERYNCELNEEIENQRQVLLGNAADVNKGISIVSVITKIQSYK